MTRVASALALLPLTIGTIWFLPPVATLVLAEVVLVLACIEYAGLCIGVGADVPRFVVVLAAMGVCAGVAVAPTSLPALLAGGSVALALVQLGRRQASVLSSTAAAVFALLYLALPVGLLVLLHARHGRGVVLLLLAVIMASDTAQYYGGRWLGRRLLAPAASPKKTIEGALFGVGAGALVMWWAGIVWLPELPSPVRVLIGLALATLGIAGDLFESSLKRAAKVKDASSLIPGHGGMLDRVDGLLFAVPIFYLVVEFTTAP